MSGITKVELALMVADTAHRAVGQVRKYTGQPYIVHPVEVMTIVQTVEHTDEMLCAALLHDVVEDTDIDIDYIERVFGSEVAELVDWLTDVSKPEDGNRKTRKALDREHSIAAPAQAQTIKMADLISNSRDIMQNDKNFARVYLREKRLLVDGMTRADPVLRAQAIEILEQAGY